MKIKWRGKGVEFTEIVPRSPVYLDRDCTPSLSFSLPHLSIPFHSDFRAFVNVVPLSLSLSRQKSSSPESTHKIKLDAVDRFNAVGLTFHRELCSSRDRNASEQPGEFQNFGNPFPGRERDYKLKFYRLITSGGRPVGNYLISIPGFVGMGERGRKGGRGEERGLLFDIDFVGKRGVHTQARCARDSNRGKAA